jgi:hypothetical protein
LRSLWLVLAFAFAVFSSGCAKPGGTPAPAHPQASVSVTSALAGLWIPQSLDPNRTGLTGVSVRANGTVRQNVAGPSARQQKLLLSVGGTWSLPSTGVVEFRSAEGAVSSYSFETTSADSSKRLTLRWQSGLPGKGNSAGSMFRVGDADEISWVTGSTGTVLFCPPQPVSANP